MDQYHLRKGYCYEAIATGMHLLSNDIGIRRYEALVLPDNTPSIRLLEKSVFGRKVYSKTKYFYRTNGATTTYMVILFPKSSTKENSYVTSNKTCP